MTQLPDRPPAPLQGDEATLFAQYDMRLRRVVGADVQTARANVEDGCAYAWAQLIIHQPRRETVFPWLRVVARNEARRLTEVERRHGITLDEVGEHARDPRDPIATREAVVDARARLDGLKPREQAALWLRAMGWSYEEAAQRLGMTRGRLNQVLAAANRTIGERVADAAAARPDAPLRVQLLAQLEREPPIFLRATIGRPPRVSSKGGGAEPRLEWRRLALAIVDYRLDHGVTDASRALGPPSLAVDDRRTALQQAIDRYTTERQARRSERRELSR